MVCKFVQILATSLFYNPLKRQELKSHGEGPKDKSYLII